MGRKVTVTVDIDDPKPIDISKLKDYVVIVLDKSGSMAMIQEQAVKLFNDQVKILRGSGSNGTTKKVCLVTFNEDVKNDLWVASPDSVKELGFADYRPDGCTALYDAVGFSVDKLKAQPDIDDPNTSVLFVIISDGHENASRTYDQVRIAEMIQTLTRTERWTFTYLGAEGINLSDISKKMAIPLANMGSYVHTPDGAAFASMKVSGAMDTYFACRAAGQTSTRCFYSGDDV